MAIELDPIASGYSTDKINAQFQKIEDELNNNVLRRDGLGLGEANQMGVPLDMNSFDIMNVNNIDVQGISIKGQSVDGYVEGAKEAAIAAAQSEANALTSKTNADNSAAYAETQAVRAEAAADSSDALLLRTELADAINPAKGAAIVGFWQNHADAIARNMLEKAREIVSPLDFGAIGDGIADDTVAMQKAFNYAIEKKASLSCWNCIFLIEGTVTINKASENRDPLHILGGNFIKQNAGDMFNAANPATSDVRFSFVSFAGVSGVATSSFAAGDGYLIRTHLNNCQFRNLSRVFYSATYLQSIYLDGCVFTEISDAVLQFGGLFDVKITRCIAEEMSTGSLVEHIPSGVYTAAEVLVIRDNALENFQSAPVINLSSCGGLIIEGNYLEKNPYGFVVFLENAQLDSARIISNTYLGDTTGTGLIVWPKFLNACTSSNNVVSVGPVHNASARLSGRIVSDNDYSGNSASNIDPASCIYVRNKNTLSPRVISEDRRFVGIPLTLTTTSTTMVNLCSFTLADSNGGGAYVTIRGGGLQGNVGVFGIKKTFKVTRALGTSNYTITPVDSESWGDTTTQHTYVELVSSGGALAVNARSSTSLASVKYDLYVEVAGLVGSVSFPA